VQQPPGVGDDLGQEGASGLGIGPVQISASFETGREVAGEVVSLGPRFGLEARALCQGADQLRDPGAQQIVGVFDGSPT
jgi:hypothetical protein